MLFRSVLAAEMLHGRRPHHPSEYLAGAADHAVAGLVGGFTPRARAEAQALLDRAGPVTGAAEVRAVLDAVERTRRSCRGSRCWGPPSYASCGGSLPLGGCRG